MRSTVSFEVHNEPDPMNTETVRTTSGIALTPTPNFDGTWEFLSLQTGHTVVRGAWTVLPTTTDVIFGVNADGDPDAFLHEWRPNVPILDLDDDQVDIALLPPPGGAVPQNDDQDDSSNNDDQDNSSASSDDDQADSSEDSNADDDNDDEADSGDDDDGDDDDGSDALEQPNSNDKGAQEEHAEEQHENETAFLVADLEDAAEHDPNESTQLLQTPLTSLHNDNDTNENNTKADVTARMQRAINRAAAIESTPWRSVHWIMP
ncbi:unnamed protein product [Cylindrotheca closterium]|uniref:Uncharacterized protein n=1 Tax=Cylindrotheca closterium TaxID=2856 RepID=A0AAD2FG75_9STRA|nr:unnamed protein product [Cylindrotheca closterium]